MFWYCIDASGGRIQETDIKLISSFSDKIVPILTKSDLLTRKGEIEKLMDSLKNHFPMGKVAIVSNCAQNGLDNLLKKTKAIVEKSSSNAPEELRLFSQRWEEYYAEKKESWKRKISDEADSLINWATGRAAAIAMIPIPLADVGPLVANEVYILQTWRNLWLRYQSTSRYYVTGLRCRISGW